MQTERVTFLTSREQKDALDAFAAERGESVGNVVREATARYISQREDEEAQLAAIAREINEAVPAMAASLERMIEMISRTNENVDRTLREAGIRK